MYAVWVNAFTVIAGGILGTVLRGGIPERYKDILNYALALCVLLIGISGAIKTENTMLVIVCMVVGALIGEALSIENALEKLGDKAKNRFAKNDSGFGQGFVSATLLFCIGSMAIIGSMEAGMNGNGATLMAKSVLDGVSSVIFASTLGPGVCLSAVPLTIYQGGIALLSKFAGQVLSADMIREMSAVGSVLIMGLGVNMLGVLGDKRIKVGNLLPAVFLPIVYILITNLF